MIQGRHSLIHEEVNVINIMNLGVTAPSHSLSFISPLDGLTFIYSPCNFPFFPSQGEKSCIIKFDYRPRFVSAEAAGDEGFKSPAHTLKRLEKFNPFPE